MTSRGSLSLADDSETPLSPSFDVRLRGAKGLSQQAPTRGLK